MIYSRVSFRILHFFQNLVLKYISFSKLGIASLIKLLGSFKFCAMNLFHQESKFTFSIIILPYLFIYSGNELACLLKFSGYYKFQIAGGTHT